MPRRIIAVEQRDLHDRHAERVLHRIECDQERGEDAVVQTPLHALGVDSRAAQRVEHFARELRRAGVGVLHGVVVVGEAVVVVDEFLGGGGVDLHGGGVGLPVGGEDDDGFGFYLRGDFAADGLQFAVGWVGVVFEEVGASCGMVSMVGCFCLDAWSWGRGCVPCERKYTGVLVMLLVAIFPAVCRFACRCFAFDVAKPSLVVTRENVFLRMLGDEAAIIVLDGKDIAAINAISEPMSRSGRVERD